MNRSYEDTIKLFMRRTYCACIRFSKLGYTINAENKSHSLQLGMDANLSRIYKRYVISDTRTISPMTLLLVGRRPKSLYPIHDLEEYLGLSRGTLDSFNQGFLDAPAFRDVWVGLKSELACKQSLLFNLGRAFLGRFCGIFLPYKLPKEYSNYFKQLE